MYDQTELFSTQHTPATARGPIQSQLTLASLGRDESLKRAIAAAVVHLCWRRYTKWDIASGRLVPHADYEKPVTDDDITERLEAVHGRRFQRNVVARTRGLMEVDGWFTPVEDVIGRTGRPTHAVIAAPILLELMRPSTTAEEAS